MGSFSKKLLWPTITLALILIVPFSVALCAVEITYDEHIVRPLFEPDSGRLALSSEQRFCLDGVTTEVVLDAWRELKGGAFPPANELIGEYGVSRNIDNGFYVESFKPIFGLYDFDFSQTVRDVGEESIIDVEFLQPQLQPKDRFLEGTFTWTVSEEDASVCVTESINPGSFDFAVLHVPESQLEAVRTVVETWNGEEEKTKALWEALGIDPWIRTKPLYEAAALLKGGLPTKAAKILLFYEVGHPQLFQSVGESYEKYIALSLQK